jgi:ATP-dependent DNA helicase RecQ
VLRGEATVRLVRSGSRVSADASDEWSGVDRGLFEILRSWRRETAAGRGVAPFVVFSDRTLREIAAVRPSSRERLRLVPGIGDARLLEHGDDLMALVDAHCEAGGLDRDARSLPPRRPPEARRPSRITPSKAESRHLFRRGATIEEVIRRTGRARSTVVKDLCELVEAGDCMPDISAWMPHETEQAIRAAASQCGLDFLRPIKDAVGESIAYDDVHVVVSIMKAESAAALPGSRGAHEEQVSSDGR